MMASTVKNGNDCLRKGNRLLRRSEVARPDSLGPSKNQAIITAALLVSFGFVIFPEKLERFSNVS